MSKGLICLHNTWAPEHCSAVQPNKDQRRKRSSARSSSHAFMGLRPLVISNGPFSMQIIYLRSGLCWHFLLKPALEGTLKTRTNWWVYFPLLLNLTWFRLILPRSFGNCCDDIFRDFWKFRMKRNILVSSRLNNLEIRYKPTVVY